MAIEFEVTKEPEGKLIYLLKSDKHKSGTVVLDLPNGVEESGKYLIHITLLQDSGERLDAHMNFRAGGGQPASKGKIGLYILVLIALIYAAYLSNTGLKRKIDQCLSKEKPIY